MDEPIKIERNALDVFEAIVSLELPRRRDAVSHPRVEHDSRESPHALQRGGRGQPMGQQERANHTLIISWLIYGMITLIERYPQIWNTGVRITKENRDQVYRLLKDLIAWVKMITLSIFGFLTVLSALARNLPVWFLLVFVVLLFGVIAYYIVRITRVRSEYPLE